MDELKEYFEGPLNKEGVPPNTPEVDHVSQLVPGQRAFLAPQIGRLKKNITLASGESATVVPTAILPRDSYILVNELPNQNNVRLWKVYISLKLFPFVWTASLWYAWSPIELLDLSL